MPYALESRLGRFEPGQRRLLIKKAAVYAEGLGQRMFGREQRFSETGEDILHITLRRIMEGKEGYLFREGDILLFDWLLRCCRKTARALQHGEQAGTGATGPHDDEIPAEELTETAALAFLLRRGSLDAFLAYIKAKKLKGKQRAYSLGFAKYGQEGWEAERIAKDLRVTPGTVSKYRSSLRELLEEFEVLRALRGSQ